MLDTLQVQGDQSDVSRLCSCAETELAGKPRICASPTGEMSVSLYIFLLTSQLCSLLRPTNFPSIKLVSHGGWAPRVVRSAAKVRHEDFEPRLQRRKTAGREAKQKLKKESTRSYGFMWSIIPRAHSSGLFAHLRSGWDSIDIVEMCTAPRLFIPLSITESNASARLLRPRVTALQHLLLRRACCNGRRAASILKGSEIVE